MKRTLLFIIVGLLLILHGAAAQTSLQQKATLSLKKMFGDSISISSTTLILTKADKDSLSSRSVIKWQTDSISTFTCKVNGNPVGYGFVDDVKGKTQFITYVTGIKFNGEVQDVDVLAYRESIGGEIVYESFRKQFRSKTVQDKLLPGRDIKNISGATISAHAITAGVKKILATFDLFRSRL